MTTTPGSSGLPSGWRDWVEAKNAKAKAKGRWRELRELDALGPRGRLAGEGPKLARPVVSFGSNDYLGLSSHPAVTRAARQALERWGAGAGGARLLTGTRPVHAALEEQLARWKGTEAALVFPSGYSANLGVLGALAAPGVLICSDTLNHASLVDGCRLATSLGARVVTYPHRDYKAAADLLEGWQGRALVVTDSVFSMDGDCAPVAELSAACASRGALLVLDDAHALLASESMPVQGCLVVRVGTLSKVLGSQGGFVAGERTMVELLVNRSRPFIFTTALAPASAAAAMAALGVLGSEEGAALLGRLRSHARLLWPAQPAPSPIVAFVAGSEARATAASAALIEEGFFVPAVRPPTVPPGTSRLRVSLSAAHTSAEVTCLGAAIERLGLGPGGLAP